MSDHQLMFLFALPFVIAIVALAKEFLFRSDAARKTRTHPMRKYYYRHGRDRRF